MEHRLGQHTIDIDGDFVVITLVGDCLAEHISAILVLIDGIGGGKGAYYVIAKVQHLDGVPPEARRIAGAWRGIGRVGGTAIVGATVLTRTLVMLVSRASTLISSTRKTGELRFYKTEEEARDWLIAHRAASSLR